MAKLRAEISTKNKWWISKHRFYELRHFCLQYQTWKKTLKILDDVNISSPNYDEILSTTNIPGNPTEKHAIIKMHYIERMHMVEKAALEADIDLNRYILKAVTEDLSFNYLKSVLDIPCGKDMYYDRYRKFFWILSKLRE